jgi:hypothetical protein
MTDDGCTRTDDFGQGHGQEILRQGVGLPTLRGGLGRRLWVGSRFDDFCAGDGTANFCAGVWIAGLQHRVLRFRGCFRM